MQICSFLSIIIISRYALIQLSNPATDNEVLLIAAFARSALLILSVCCLCLCRNGPRLISLGQFPAVLLRNKLREDMTDTM